jgi:hypothetical protein
MENDQRVIIQFFVQQMEYDETVFIRFLSKQLVSPKDIHTRLEAQFGDATDSERSFGGRASMFGKEAKTCRRTAVQQAII